MQRRRFLNALSGSAAACAASDGVARAAASQSPPGGPGVTPVRPSDDQGYFSEERLRAVIDTGLPIEGLACETVAYNFPAWHVTPFMEERFGRGWTELDMVRRSRPLYPGHLFPKYPLWTDFDEADPADAAREIDLAADFGVDVWMIDWYWHDGVMFYHEQLEDGFLKAANRSRLKFAVMWANHHWKNVYPASSPDAASVILPQRHSEDDMRRVTEYCIEHYFSQPNYWRIGGLPVFAIFDLRLMVETFGVSALRRVLDEMRERAARAGLGGLHIQASHVYDPAQLREVGIDSATRYHTFGYTYGGRPAGERTTYGEAAVETVRKWQSDVAQLTIPYFPDCPTGWDDSARYGAGAHMVTQRTPDQYERLLRAAQHFLAEHTVEPKAVFLSAWNEWTEDSFLLPDSVFGYSYLDAVRRAFRRGR